MRARAFTEHRIRVKVAVQHPSWCVDITGSGVAILTNIMGHKCMVTFRHRRRYWGDPIMRAAKWIVPAVTWLLMMWMASTVVMALAMGVRL